MRTKIRIKCFPIKAKDPQRYMYIHDVNHQINNEHAVHIHSGIL